MRQTLVDEGEQGGANYEYAYTMVSKDDYSAVKRLMGRLDCGTTYDHSGSKQTGPTGEVPNGASPVLFADFPVWV